MDTIIVKNSHSCSYCKKIIPKFGDAIYLRISKRKWWHPKCFEKDYTIHEQYKPQSKEYPALGLIDNLMLTWFKSCHQNWKFI